MFPFTASGCKHIVARCHFMYIYRITNKINRKSYVGLTRLSVEERWKRHLRSIKSGSLPKLYAAILKYGPDNFSIETIDTASTLQELSDKEIQWIKTLDTVKDGYNIAEGGINMNSDSYHSYWSIITPAEKERYGKAMSLICQGRIRKNAASLFVGVCKKRSEWEMAICKDGQRIRKTFPTEISAAQAYDKLALLFYGSSARTNFPERFSSSELQNFYQTILIPKPRATKHPHKYKGVTYSKNGHWIGRVMGKNRKMIASSFAKTEEAAYLALQAKLAIIQSSI